MSMKNLISSSDLNKGKGFECYCGRTLYSVKDPKNKFDYHNSLCILSMSSTVKQKNHSIIWLN